VRVADYNSAVKLVNDHEYGNGTAIFTRDGDAARDSPPRSRSAWWDQCADPVPMAFHSFGGWKRSLFGDHHMHGPRACASIPS
jgi:NAD-dependent aldehyde dehydrogenases